MSDPAAPSPTLTVACCEDEPALARLLDECFRAAGHSAVFARTGDEALRRFSGDGGIDVIVMDIGLPDGDGRDVCRALRANGQKAPVLFLSALGQVHDIVQGFAAGGMDYLVKPFAVPELLARLESLARRVTPPGPVDGLRLDSQRFALCNGPEERVLTPTEFRITAELVSRAGDVVRRAELVNAAWVPGAKVNGNTLDTYIHRIRRLLVEIDADARLETVRRVGYVLRRG